MSKLIKKMIMDDLKQRLDGVNDALLVNIAGLNTDQTFRLRKELRSKGVSLLMIKNSLARRATKGTPLAAAFEVMEGSLALCWGSEDIVALAKIVAKLSDDKTMAPFAPRGGVLDGSRLTADQVTAVSKWPSRPEVLSMLVGQIFRPGGPVGRTAQRSGRSFGQPGQGKSQGGRGDGSPAETAADAAASS